jgi:cytochrome P450
MKMVTNSGAGKLFGDKEVFENPNTFRPERFIENPGLLETVEYVFGGGRVSIQVTSQVRDVRKMIYFQRICAGMHLAKNSLVSSTQTLLYVLFNSDISDFR